MNNQQFLDTIFPGEKPKWVDMLIESMDDGKKLSVIQPAGYDKGFYTAEHLDSKGSKKTG